jgi:hypothetical protein
MRHLQPKDDASQQSRSILLGDCKLTLETNPGNPCSSRSMKNPAFHCGFDLHQAFNTAPVNNLPIAEPGFVIRKSQS